MNGGQKIEAILPILLTFNPWFQKFAKPLTSLLKITLTQSAKNLLLDIAEDAMVRNGTSSTTKSAKNLSLNIAEDVEVGGNGNGGDDETVERSFLSKKPNGPTS